MLLARLVNANEWLQWAKTEAATKNRDQPEPVLPPWQREESRGPIGSTKATAMSLEEVEAFMAAQRGVTA